MNRTLHFFDYEHCYILYAKNVISIRQKKINGETIVAKPVLLVAIFDCIEDNVFMNNQFVINGQLEKRYNILMQQFTKNSQFEGVTGIEKPFWHLESDGFWHLNYQGERLGKGHTPSKTWQKDNVDYAYFDEPLWTLLQNKMWRTKLRNYIIEHKLTGDL